MKYLATQSILFIAIILMGTACEKPTAGHTSGKTPDTPELPRVIQFSLYTDKDFSDDNKNITFTLFILTYTDLLNNLKSLKYNFGAFSVFLISLGLK